MAILDYIFQELALGTSQTPGLVYFFTQKCLFLGELKANKLLLGLVSEVFKAQFFGKLPESSKERCNILVCIMHDGFKITNFSRDQGFGAGLFWDGSENFQPGAGFGSW